APSLCLTEAAAGACSGTVLAVLLDVVRHGGPAWTDLFRYAGRYASSVLARHRQRFHEKIAGAAGTRGGGRGARPGIGPPRCHAEAPAAGPALPGPGRALGASLAAPLLRLQGPR
ncbi:unnamed protein product, partial [Ixodes pacificus]